MRLPRGVREGKLGHVPALGLILKGGAAMIRLLGDESTGDVTVLRFSGEIDEFSVSSLRSVLRCKARSKCPALLLDFTDVTYVNSRGMAALIEYWRESRNFAGYFAIVGLNENLREIFHIVHLDESVWLFPTVDSALKGRPSESIGSMKSFERAEERSLAD